MELIVSYSGIRFRDEPVARLGPAFSMAYSEYLDAKHSSQGHLANMGTVLLARDTRHTSEFYKDCFASALSGYNVVDLGVCPVPSLQWVMNNSFQNVVGAVMVSASHNELEWNGFKMLQPSGLCLNHDDITGILNAAKHYLNRDISLQERVLQECDAWIDHLNAIYTAIPGDYSHLSVAIDTCNGAARLALPMLLKMYGCEVHQLDNINNRGLTRNPHPIAANISKLGEYVKSKGCHLGFATDSDGDRLAIVDENGNVLDEAYSVLFSIWEVLRERRGLVNTVVTNLSSTRMVDDLVFRLGGKLIKCPVGELKVARSMTINNAIVGGEASCAGVIYPMISPGRDALSAASLVLSLMSSEDKPISALVDAIPKYSLVSDKIYYSGDIEKVLSVIREDFSMAAIDNQDGVRVDMQPFWFHVRKSNTEPVVRIIVEAEIANDAKMMLHTLKNYFSA